MPSELGGEHEPDRPNRQPESGRSELTPEQRWEWAKSYAEGLSEYHAQEQAKSLAAAEARGLTREQWRRYQSLDMSDSIHEGELESARYRLRHDPPDWMGGKHFTPEPQRTEYYAKAREQENKALDHFRTEPAEGPENKPLDPERRRPVVRWTAGDPPIDPGDTRFRDAVVYVRPERRDGREARSGLGKADAAPDPKLTPEEHQEKIERQRGLAAEALGRANWSNSHYAGKTYDNVSPALRERYPEGVQFSDEGFPMLDRYAAKTVVFEEGFRGPTRDDDFRRANEIFGWRRPPAGMTWHHKEDNQTMLLVDERLHRKVGHYGGVAASKAMGLWEGEG